MRHVLMFAFLTVLVACSGGSGGSGAPAGGGTGSGVDHSIIPSANYIFKDFSETFTFGAQSESLKTRILDEDPAPTPVMEIQKDVYVSGYIVPTEALDAGGYNAYTPVYWKNGEMTLLEESAYGWANSIYVDDQDHVYIAGTEPYEGGAILWVDGEKTILSLGDADNADAFAVVVQDGDVYVAGDLVVGANGHAGYWVNGEFNRLPENGSDSWAYSIFFDSDGTRYIAGSTGGYACYWKGDELIELIGANAGVIAVSVFVDDIGSVYVGGSAFAGSIDEPYNDAGYQRAVYWQDGQRVVLPKNPLWGDNEMLARIMSIYKKGDSLVLAGGSSDTGTCAASIWGSDIFSSMNAAEPLEVSSTVTGVTVSGLDIYAVGVLDGLPFGASDTVVAAVWVNGVKKNLSDPTTISAEATGIFVK